MNLPADNQHLQPNFEKQSFIPINLNFNTVNTPLIWYYEPIVNPTTNISFFLPFNSTEFLNPPIVQIILTTNQNLSIDSNQFLHLNLQKTFQQKQLHHQILQNQCQYFTQKSRNYQQTLKRKKVIQKPNQRWKQDPKRNIVTNIGNQLLTFTTNKQKCRKVFEIMKKYDQKQLTRFFSYSSRLRSRIGYYLNYAKMKKIWYPKQLNKRHQTYQTMLRTVSYYYLTQIFMSIVLNSSKMKNKSKTYHIKAIRKLIKDLRNPPRPH